MYTITGKHTSALVINDNIEQEAVDQIYANVNCRAYEGQKIVIQPDSHCGKGSVIGFCSTVGDYINPCTVGVDIGCFTENTKVELTDGRQLTFKELINEHELGKDNYVYAIDNNGNVCITKINCPKQTKIVDKLCKIELDNGEIIECTLDHLFMLRDGSYKEASQLQVNESLMPLYIDFAKNQKENLHSYWKEVLTEYKVIYDPKVQKYIYIHYLSDNFNERNNYLRIVNENTWVRHHIDFNKYNNNPSNVQRYGFKEHFKIHSDHVNVTNKLELTGFRRAAELHPNFYSVAGKIGMSKNWQNPDFAERRRQNTIKMNKTGVNYIWSTSECNKARVANMGKDVIRQLHKNPEYNVKTNFKRLLKLCEYIQNLNLEVNEENLKIYRKNKINDKYPFKNIFTNERIIKELKLRGFWEGSLTYKSIKNTYDSIILKIDNSNTNLYKNHKVTKIEIIDSPNTKVYCLVNQEFDNFALSAGVFVHNCSISMNLYDKPIPEDKYVEFNHKILKEIGWGFNTSPKKVYEDKEMYKFMSTKFRKAKSKHPEIFDELPDNVTEKWIDSFLKRIGMDARTFYYSINSVGGGNHYVEYDVNEDAKLYGVTVHCGSRNLGVKVCKYWENVSKGGALPKSKVKEATNEFKIAYKKTHSDMKNFKNDLNEYLKALTKDHIEGFLTGENMNRYFCDMLVAMSYAKFNHQMIHKTIDNIMLKYGCKKVRDIVSVHNYVDFNEDVPIIRKGAIRSYVGEEMLVPFNMRDGVAICEGKSNSEWLNSCAHGAGRKMSRAKAKSNLSMDEFTETMKNVYSTTVCKGTIDEAPMAYKDTNEIVELIKNTCDVKYMLVPKINIKAVDGAE